MGHETGVREEEESRCAMCEEENWKEGPWKTG